MAGFFDYSKPGKGISKEDVDKSGFALYFDILLRRIWKMITSNALYIITSIPAILIGIFISFYLIGNIISFAGIALDENSYRLMRFLLLPFTALILQVTGSGPASVAMNYIMGKYVKDTHVWVWSDFIDNIKHNFKQGMAVYIINTVIFSILSIAYLFYTYVMTGLIAQVLKAWIIIFAVVFFIMQFYVYRLVAEFELKIKHIYKNALILVIAGLKWNILSVIIVGGLMFLLGYAIFAGKIMVGIAALLLIYFSLVTFTQLFVTNNVVNKYLLEPALENENE